MIRLLILLLALFASACSTDHPNEEHMGHSSASLLIHPLSPHVLQHVSYFESGEYGRVPCNGMIVHDAGKAIVFDTPVQDSVSDALVEWLKSELGASVIAVVPTHFHDDCLGGLKAFHARGIPSYANTLTIERAMGNQTEVPQQGFEGSHRWTLGSLTVEASYLGPGHTRDNIVAYVEADKALFGGCLIKAQGAAKGNLADADTLAWPHTMRRLRTTFPEAELVIPGHGEPGGMVLVDYTEALFEASR